MGIRLEMEFKALAVLFLLLAISWAQDKKFDSFAWRPMKLQRPSSLQPYHHPESTTTSYDSRFFDDSSAPFHGSTRFYPDSPSPYRDGPGSYSVDSYSPDFPKPYRYPEDSGSYEQYGATRDDEFNITMERYGGFGGTGDTRGYGAYDYPKKVHHDVPQELGQHDDEPKIDTSFPDLLRLGRDRFHHERNPHHMHPLPPPL